MSRIETPATLHVCANPGSGEVFVLLGEKEVIEELQVVLRDYKEKAEADKIEWMVYHSERSDELAEARTSLEGDDLATRAAADFQTLANLETSFLQNQAARLKRFEAELKARELRLLAERAEAIRSAQVMRFRLARPTYGQHENILKQAEVADPMNGVNTIDDRLYRQLLLKAHPKTVFLEGKELTPEQIDDLDPAVGATLGSMLSRSLAVDRNRLVFTSSASVPASTNAFTQ